jgi:hypothetical protein
MTFIEKQNSALEQLDSIVKPTAMPSDVLSAISAEARRLGRPLDGGELDAIYARFD